MVSLMEGNQNSFIIKLNLTKQLYHKQTVLPTNVFFFKFHYYCYQLPLVVTFIDFKKAFDSINRKVMFVVLRHYGIPEAVVNAISVLYKNSKSAVMMMMETYLTHLTSLLESCREMFWLIFLFVVLVDYLLKRSRRSLTLEL